MIFFLMTIPWGTLLIIIVWMILYTENEYNKYFAPCNKEIYVKPFKFVIRNLPPLKSVITLGRFMLLVSNILLTFKHI